jgi:hypothetical protein
MAITRSTTSLGGRGTALNRRFILGPDDLLRSNWRAETDNGARVK